jgi:NADH:ubiquinone oxidoreductase subunit 3 (subunit A)
LLTISFLLSPRKKDEEFESPYECGFDPFTEAHIPFDVKFYLVSILFIVFDLEISFILPWVVSFEYIGLSGFFSINLFLIILILGYFVEWAKKALD